MESTTMKKSICWLTTSCIALPILSHADSPYFSFKDGDDFKRFSVSAGWLHVMPQGKANPFNISTTIPEGKQSAVGRVKADSVLNAIDTSTETGAGKKKVLEGVLNSILAGTISDKDENGVRYLKPEVAGQATLNGLSQWTAEGTGLEADNVDTLGIISNYHFTDHVSLEVKAGIPPKVDIKGKGEITAHLSGSANPGGLGAIIGELPLKQDIPITDLSSQSSAASARAWTPAVELHYQFGKSGVNKFRPYLGIGVMYAYFNDLKVNPSIESDLVAAGHMIQNINDGKAGQALDKINSSADPKVKLDAEDAWAPIVTAGFTYDFKPNWFAVASVSYAKLNNNTNIDVVDNHTGNQLIHATTKIDIDPILTYMGVGYRF